MASLLRNNSVESSGDTITRKALNPGGSIGALYDGYRDRIIDQTNKSYQEQWYAQSTTTQCKLEKNLNSSNFNILKFIDMEDELRLNLLLMSTKRNGIAKILDYPYQMDQCTYILYYSWIKREKRLKKLPTLHEIDKQWSSNVTATHMITSVLYGIDLVIMLQLPVNTEIYYIIDAIFSKIQKSLGNDGNCYEELTLQEKHSLGCILDFKVYSNSPALTCVTTIPSILLFIEKIKKDSKLCQPVIYNLQSMTSLYNAQQIKQNTYRTLPKTLSEKLEDRFLGLRNDIKDLEMSLQLLLASSFQKIQRYSYQKESGMIFEIKDKYKTSAQTFVKILVDTMKKRANISDLLEALDGRDQLKLKESILELNEILNQLTKSHALGSSSQSSSKPTNASKNATKTNCNTSNTQHCASTISKNHQDLELDNSSNHEYYMRLNSQENKRASNKNVSTVHNEQNDTKHCVPKHLRAVTSPLNHTATHEKVAEQPLSISSETSLPKDETINILLLGETGVGKSTFINAFANYLTFNSFDQAQSSEPIVIIPVSFIVTTGDNFEEHEIKFGEVENPNNEDFNNLGQSVTQHCKSYTFELKDDKRREVRIIDTPGCGDTRGIEQDDQNMEHILQYINNLTHLNAICFLLKPNTTRLNIFFRMCLTHLFSLLSPTVRHNIIFCFTNARSTFYAPGNTAPLLRKMLADPSMNGVRFEKDNTFCFDNESFRYLVALQNDMTFNEVEKSEYEVSWSTSVKESKRLMDYIKRDLTVYNINNGWQSIKHAQYEIIYMIRPILETMRNLLRNIILFKKNLSNKSIKLAAKPAPLMATRCLSCKSEPQKIGFFWILPSTLHLVENDCCNCSCDIDQHVPIEYTLEYECSNFMSNDVQSRMGNIRNTLCDSSVFLSHFLLHKACCTKEDAFLNGLKEMIAEESNISKTVEGASLNGELVKELSKYLSEYEQQMKRNRSEFQKTTLEHIYKLIEILSGYDEVREQIEAVKQRQQMMIEEYEYEARKI